MSSATETRELFKSADDERMVGFVPSSKSGDRITEYVLEELPGYLRGIREEEIDYGDLASSQHSLIEDAEKTLLTNTSAEVAKRMQLDMLFMLGGYLPAGKDAYKRAPATLLSLIEYQAERFNLPRRMDYDLIIDYNSQEYGRSGQMRQYLDGANAPHERDFYLGHYLTEPSVKMAAYALKGALMVPDHTDVPGQLVLAGDRMGQFSKDMAQYGRMPDESFAELRQYLLEYPEGVRNASGAFLPSVQMLELLLCNPGEDSEYAKFIDTSLPYFPAWSQPIIKEQFEAATRGENIEDAIHNGKLLLDEEARRGLLGVVNAFIVFRNTHLNITKRKIPEAFPEDRALVKEDLKRFGERPILSVRSESEAGSAGFDVINVLGNAVARLERLKSRVEDLA